MSRPLITIVMPVYNGAPFLADSVGSVIHQNYREWELLLIDDGSTDESAQICARFAAEESRIHLLQQENGGPAAARNYGVTEGKGEYLYFLDADDRLAPETLESMLSLFTDETDMVLSGFQKEEAGRINPQPLTLAIGEEPLREAVRTLSKEQIDPFIYHFLASPSNHLVSYCWARLYRYEIIRREQLVTDPAMRLFEDFIFNLSYLRHCKNIVVLNKPLYTYVQHNDDSSASMGILNSSQLIPDMEKFKQGLTNHFGQSNELDRAIGHTLVHYCIIFFVRSCRNVRGEQRKKIIKEFTKMVNSGILCDSLKMYKAGKQGSKLIPFLMRMRLISLLIPLCHYKWIKRYGAQ